MNSQTYLQKLILCAFFSALTVTGAYITIPLPFSPVPLTLQSFFVLMSGAILGPVFGALSQILYILLGIMGLPVFAGFASGPFVLIGPTGGYLLGFVISSFLVGLVCKFSNKKNMLFYLIVFIFGTMVIYIFGIIGLMFFMHINFTRAFFVGVLPFVVGDFFKITAASFLIIKLRNKIFKSKNFI